VPRELDRLQRATIEHNGKEWIVRMGGDELAAALLKAACMHRHRACRRHRRQRKRRDTTSAPTTRRKTATLCHARLHSLDSAIDTIHYRNGVFKSGQKLEVWRAAIHCRIEKIFGT
jgi:hypothetical protein